MAVVSLTEGLDVGADESVSRTFRQAAAVDREQLIESHLPLVRAIARRYAGRGETLDDLVQVGSIGLIRAGDRFDPERGVAFATFATPAIEGEIRRHLGDRTTSLRIPRELQRISGQLQRARTQLGASLGRAPNPDELAATLGVAREDVERGLEAEQARLASSEASDVDEVAGEYEFGPSTDDRVLLGLAARVLNERERRIVFLRFHADMTERDIAGELGISQAQVSRLLASALAKLREELDDEHPATDLADTTQKGAISRVERGAEAQTTRQKRGKTGSPRPAESRIADVGASQRRADRAATVPPQHEAAKASRGKTEQRKAGASPSGRFLVRMPSELHQELATAAEREQVSLNRFVTDTLAASLSGSGTPAASQGGMGGAEPSGRSPAPPRRSFRMLLAANVVVMVVAAAAAVVLLILALQHGL